MNGNRGKMRDATAEAQECDWRRLRLTWLSVRGVSAYLLFGDPHSNGVFRLRSAGASLAQDDRELELGRVDTFQKRIASGGPMPKYGFPLCGGNAYLVLPRSTQQWGLSTPFG